jgi:ribosomal protein L13E
MVVEPKIFSRGKTRPGRGFSYLELKKANIDIRMAKNLGLRVDKRRRTVYEENVKLLGEKVRGAKKRRREKR